MTTNAENVTFRSIEFQIWVRETTLDEKENHRGLPWKYRVASLVNVYEGFALTEEEALAVGEGVARNRSADDLQQMRGMRVSAYLALVIDGQSSYCWIVFAGSEEETGDLLADGGPYDSRREAMNQGLLWIENHGLNTGSGK